MKRIKSLFNYVLVSEIFFLLIGIMMTIRPKEALITCNFMIAIFMLITGMLIVLGKPFKKFAFKEIGMLSIILGIVLILKPEILSIVLPIVCGIYFVTMGYMLIKASYVLKEIHIDNWKISYACAILIMASGLLMIINPIPSAYSIVIFVGVNIIVSSISGIVDMFILKKHVKDISKIIK